MPSFKHELIWAICREHLLLAAACNPGQRPFDAVVQNTAYEELNANE